jgi:hypothetical protein
MRNIRLDFRVVVDVRSIWKGVLIAALLLWVANLLAGWLVATGHMAFNHPLHLIFSFNLERNLPTFFSGCLLLLNALLFHAKAAVQRPMGREHLAWLLLACVFVFLAADELFAIHERLVRPVREAFGLGGFFYFSWVVVYGAAVLVFIALLLPFWLAMPKQPRVLYLASALVYLSGAIGMEMLGGRHLETNGGRNFTYFLMYTAEESLEIAGLLLLTFTQLLAPQKSLQPLRRDGAVSTPSASAAPATCSNALHEARPSLPHSR